MTTKPIDGFVNVANTNYAFGNTVFHFRRGPHAETKKRVRGTDHYAQTCGFCFLVVVERHPRTAIRKPVVLAL